MLEVPFDQTFRPLHKLYLFPKFQRLTIWASCPMNLQKFPLDSQVCPLQIGSFGYSAEDIIYKWAKPTAVSLDEIGMAQFLLKDYQSYETIAVSNRRTK